MEEMDKTQSYFAGAASYGKEIVEYLNNGKKVIIDSGCVNDEIIGYKEFDGEYDKYLFISTECVFPYMFVLTQFEYISTEVFKDSLFVHVM